MAIGAVTGAAGGYAGGSGLNNYQLALAQGFVGGVGSMLSGEGFGPAFLSAAVGSYLGSAGLHTGNAGGDLLVAAAIGGTVSVIGGGKFGNGAVTGAFAYVLAYQSSQPYRAACEGAGCANADQILASCDICPNGGYAIEGDSSVSGQEARRRQSPDEARARETRAYSEKAPPLYPENPDNARDQFGRIKGTGARKNTKDGSVWEKDRTRHGGSEWKRWPDRKSCERGDDPNSIWPDGRIRK